MTVVVRAPRLDELELLSDLCFRSKAVWGYDRQFMEACREELTLSADALDVTRVGVADANGVLAGVAQFELADSRADLLKLFVEPELMRGGVGRRLLLWVSETAREMGVDALHIEADPGAAPFYRRMGARDAGSVPSGSIPGRLLPKLILDL